MLLSGGDSTVVMITVEPSRKETVMVKLSTELSMGEFHSISPVTSLVPWEVTLYCTPDGLEGGASPKRVKKDNDARDYKKDVTDLVAGE